MPDQQIRFCTTSDGVRIAYGVAGDGPPVVFCPGIYSHIELDWVYPCGAPGSRDWRALVG